MGTVGNNDIQESEVQLIQLFFMYKLSTLVQCGTFHLHWYNLRKQLGQTHLHCRDAKHELFELSYNYQLETGVPQ